MKGKLKQTAKYILYIALIIILAIGASENGKRLNKLNQKELKN